MRQHARLMATELSALFTLYHQPRPESAAFQLMVRDWCDTLDTLTPDEFLACLKRAKQRCRFVPTPADVYHELETVRRLGELAGGRRMALAAHSLPPVDWEHQQRMAHMVLRRLRRNDEAAPLASQ